MHRIGDQFIFSASDLNNYLECRHLTELSELVAVGRLDRPETENAQAALLSEKGEEHERSYLAQLKAGHEVVEFGPSDATLEAYRAAEQATLDAMRGGARYIYQATFFDGTFLGRADFLRRVEVPSPKLNTSWSYEVIDTKLALSTKPYFIVQLCNYSEHLERLTGATPHAAHVVLGNGAERSYDLTRFSAFYRHLKASFLAFAHDAGTERVYPLKTKHCQVCAFDAQCKKRRRDDDHLSIVARMRNDQIVKLESAGVSSVAALAQAQDKARPFAMHPETFATLRRQAHMQVRGRTEGPVYEIIEHGRSVGFGLLPAPDEGDVFFDMEGDPLYEPGVGLEYLFGAWTHDHDPFVKFWALTRGQEKQAFEQFVDFIVARRATFPNLHVYHYAPYEKTALKKLAQRHNTREREVDELLRGEVLVDLYAVARQSLVISEDSYSIKRFEKFYNFKRETDVRKGDDSIVMFETWLATKQQSLLDDIEAYNRDDCRSTLLLREWLLARRAESGRVLGGIPDFREHKNGEAKEPRDAEEEARRSELESALLAPLPPVASQSDYDALTSKDRIRYLLGSALGYHRREEKPIWWAYFDRRENPDELFEFDREAIARLERAHDIAPRPEKKSQIYTYRFPEQRFKLNAGDSVADPSDPEIAKGLGTIHAIDHDARTIELKTTKTHLAETLSALIPFERYDSKEQQKAIARVATSFAAGTLRTQFPAIADILAATPHFQIDASSLGGTVRSLQESYLFIQGPPGTGKTTKTAAIIADLLQAGKRIAVTSKGHRATQHLIAMVEQEMHARGARFSGLYKHAGDGSVYTSTLAEPMVTSINDNKAFVAPTYDLAGGTAFLFSREFDAPFDYVFIDEAGQVSLADTIAICTCARNIVLLGDPAQLAQVSQGSHPFGTDTSVLEYLLGDRHTVTPEKGFLLDVSFRMHPEICSFISDLMYDGKLHAGPKTIHHRINSETLAGSGLRYIPVAHAGNSASSPEEADIIAAEISALMRGAVADDDGVERPMRASDIIVVTPYNAQRLLIERKLRAAGLQIAVGTVDKFQGQQAAVVFYSMATSSGDDVPRDIGFLFEQNRLNVAVSRARAMTVLVCSPRLLDIPCSTVEQMVLVNILCAYIEKANR